MKDRKDSEIKTINYGPLVKTSKNNVKPSSLYTDYPLDLEEASPKFKRKGSSKTFFKTEIIRCNFSKIHDFIKNGGEERK